MGTAKLLSLILPLVPELLEFVSYRLDRLAAPDGPPPPKTELQITLETVHQMVRDIAAAHPEWSDEDKRRTAASATHFHLNKLGIVLSDSQVNRLLELYAGRLADLRKAA